MTKVAGASIVASAPEQSTCTWTTNKTQAPTSPAPRCSNQPSAHEATALKLTIMAIKPITGVGYIPNWLHKLRIRADVMSSDAPKGPCSRPQRRPRYVTYCPNFPTALRAICDSVGCCLSVVEQVRKARTNGS